jgi:hypothetical protein
MMLLYREELNLTISPELWFCDSSFIQLEGILYSYSVSIILVRQDLDLWACSFGGIGGITLRNRR